MQRVLTERMSLSGTICYMNNRMHPFFTDQSYSNAYVNNFFIVVHCFTLMLT